MIPVFGEVGIPSEKVTIGLLNKSGDVFKTISVRRGVLLWVALRRFGIPVGASCSGVGVCGKCAIRVVAPTDEKALTGKTEFEAQTLAKQGLSEDLRLSCLCRVTSGLTITADYW